MFYAQALVNAFVFLFSMSNIQALNPTSWVRNKMDIFSTTPKKWHIYVRSYIQHQIVNVIRPAPFQDTHKSFLLKSLKLTSHFKEFNSSEILFQKMKAKQSKYFNRLNKLFNDQAFYLSGGHYYEPRIPSGKYFNEFVMNQNQAPILAHFTDVCGKTQPFSAQACVEEAMAMAQDNFDANQVRFADTLTSLFNNERHLLKTGIKQKVRNASGQFFLNSNLQVSLQSNLCYSPLFQSRVCGGYSSVHELAPDIYYRTLNMKYSFEFRLSWQLHVNITFHIVMFVSGLANFDHIKNKTDLNSECVFGELRVVWPRVRQEHYCGYHPLFSAHPNHSNTTVYVVLHPSTEFNVSGEFMVEDTTAVQAFVTQTKVKDVISSILLEKQTALGFASGSASSFHITTRKDKSLVIRTSLDNKFLVVFNGPGPKSETITPHHKQYTCTSFQCVVTLVHPNSKSVHYHPEKSDPVHMNEQNTSFSLPEITECGDNRCFLKFASSQQKQQQYLNLTVTKLEYQGDKSGGCLLGGFTTAQIIGSNFQQNIILCEDIDKNLDIGRSFYSETSYMLVILYWFKNYSNMQVTLSVKDTDCQILQICPCSIDNVCEGSWKSDLPRCTVLAQERGDQLGMWFADYKEYLVILNEHTMACVVVQIVKKSFCPFHSKKRMMIQHFEEEIDHVPHLGQQFNLEITTESRENIIYTMQGEIDQTLSEKMEKLAANNFCSVGCGFQNRLEICTNKIPYESQFAPIVLPKALLESTIKKQQVFLRGQLPLEAGARQITPLNRFFWQQPLHAKNWFELQFRYYRVILNLSEANMAIHHQVFFQQQVCSTWVSFVHQQLESWVQVALSCFTDFTSWMQLKCVFVFCRTCFGLQRWQPSPILGWVWIQSMSNPVGLTLKCSTVFGTMDFFWPNVILLFCHMNIDLWPQHHHGAQLWVSAISLRVLSMWNSWKTSWHKQPTSSHKRHTEDRYLQVIKQLTNCTFLSSATKKVEQYGMNMKIEWSFMPCFNCKTLQQKRNINLTPMFLGLKQTWCVKGTHFPCLFSQVQRIMKT